VAFMLVLCAGNAIRSAGEEMGPGVRGDLVRAIGAPAGWIADLLPLADLAHDATAWLSPDEKLVAGAGFDSQERASSVTGREVPPVTADAFDPADLGAKPPPRRPLRRLLVTGDSLSTPLDIELARKLSGRGVEVIREPHLGTALSKSFVVDWASLSATQVKRLRPDAVVVFIGANEGFPLKSAGGKQLQCCGPGWAAIYAFRVRRMMNTYRQRGAARVYWLTLPLPRAHARQEVAHAVNAAIDVASVPYRSTTRVLDIEPVFTPDNRYRDAMSVGGRNQIVREPDGIHLNDTGAEVAAGLVLDAVKRDFGK
jgi:hypothetical protein